MWRAERGFNERDLKIALAIGLLDNKKKAADYAEVSERTVYNRCETNKEFIEQVISWVRELRDLATPPARMVLKEQQLDELRALYGEAIDQLRAAVRSGDMQSARFLIEKTLDRDHGKPKAKLEIEGGVKHRHYLMPPEVSQTVGLLEQATAASRELYLEAVDEAELIHE